MVFPLTKEVLTFLLWVVYRFWFKFRRGELEFELF